MEDKGYRRLFWKIVISTLVFSLLPLFTLGLSLYYQYSVSYTERVKESLRSRLENRRNAIDLFLDERVAQLITLVFTNSFAELSDEAYLNQVFTTMQSRAKSFVDVGIIDREGNHVAYVGPYQLRGLSYKNEEWFHEVMMRGVYISDVFMGFRKFPHFIIAVMRREGDHPWILRVSIDTGILDSLVKAAQLGKNGDAFVINKDGILQTAPRLGGEVLSKIGYGVFPKFEGTRIEETKVEGQRALLGATWLKNKDWDLIIREDPTEELIPLFHARVLVFALLAGGLLLIVVGAVVVSRAMISQLVQADRDKARLDASLVQSSKMAALGKLAAGIAHEVNNPLAVIKEKVGWLKDLLSEDDISGSENFDEFTDAVKKIDYHVDRAKKVTHRLLGFARRMEPVQERVDINRVLDETIDFLRNEAHYRSIGITTQFSEPLPQTTSDSSQLQQVFLNILNNAIDAVGKNGKIAVVTNYLQKEKEISISISDNGPGIPNDLLNKIFDPFFTTKEVGAGTGLGLSISYSIIEKLGGRILVASEEGKGTTFTIYLPIRTETGPSV